MGFRAQNNYDDDQREIYRQNTTRRQRIYDRARACVIILFPIIVGLAVWWFSRR